MYCIKCGSEIPDGASFCSSCGSNVTERQNSNGGVYYTERNLGLTLILSLILLGAGHMYIGLIKKGITYLIMGYVLVITAAALFFFIPIIGLVMMLITLIFVIWTVFDAYGLAKQYNSELRMTGRPPW